MEMNNLTKERVAGKVLAAIEAEGLMNKEVAEIFNTDAASMSHLKRPEHYKLISTRVWDIMHDWDITGKPIRGYKAPVKEPGKGATESLQATPAAPVITPDKQAIAKKARKQNERHHTPGGKVETEKINIKTGVLISIEVFEDYVNLKIKR
jgi:hypothetical protein